jgi:hypothetical protein
MSTIRFQAKLTAIGGRGAALVFRVLGISGVQPARAGVALACSAEGTSEITGEAVRMMSLTFRRRAVGLIALSLAALTVRPDSGAAGVPAVDASMPMILGTPTAVVSVDTSRSAALSSGFAGYNFEIMYSGVEYRDPRLRDIAAGMSIGWLRYPGGTASDAFDWTTGQMQQTWIDHFHATNPNDDTVIAKLQEALKVLSGKGGASFNDAAALSEDVGSVGLIVCVNAFTDTPESAGSFAAYAKASGIKVLAWELSNEPYYFSGSFANATDYAKQMKPFAEKIKAADPRARIALFASDAGHQRQSWDDALSAYAPRYWDLIAYHQYPSSLSNVTDTSTLMSLLNDVLVNGTNRYVTGQIVPRFGAMPVIITEFDPLDGTGTYGLPSTLYGGVWAAEYAVRLSSSGQVQRVGMHQLINPSGIELTDNHLADVLQAYRHGTTVDTTPLDFGYFQSAQAVAYGVAASAVNSASHAYSTSVRGGGTVSLASGGSVPALYAQAYKRRESREPARDPRADERSNWMDMDLVVTNKGAAPEVISIAVNGHAVWSDLLVTTATGATGATDVNMPGHADVVATTAMVADSTVLIPAYSVVRVSWHDLR